MRHSQRPSAPKPRKRRRIRGHAGMALPLLPGPTPAELKEDVEYFGPDYPPPPPEASGEDF